LNTGVVLRDYIFRQVRREACYLTNERRDNGEREDNQEDDRGEKNRQHRLAARETRLLQASHRRIEPYCEERSDENQDKDPAHQIGRIQNHQGGHDGENNSH
jgi:hypothetical protein